MLAMVVNDNAESLIPRGALRFIASSLLQGEISSGPATRHSSCATGGCR